MVGIELALPARAPSLWITIQVLVTLALVLGASCATYWLLVRRWTSHRQWSALSEWGRDHGFAYRVCGAGELPPPLDVPRLGGAVVRLCIVGPSTTLIQLQATSPPAPPGPPSIAPRGLAPDVAAHTSADAAVWNLLIRRLDASWQPTGLRPAAARHSVLDLFPLTSFPLLGSTERFVVFGTSSSDARTLSQSMARSLLPPDVGLLLHGRELVLDFSDRPFDPLEFSRMIALAEQLAQKLPAPSKQTA